MLIALVAVSSLIVLAPADDGLSRQQLAQLVHAAQEANGRDVSFDYEGRQVAPKRTGAAEIRMSYTGTFRRRADGATFADIYLSKNQSGKASHVVLGVLDGSTGLSTQEADQKKANITLAKRGTLEYAGPSNFREIWLADWIEKLAGSAYRYEYEGRQNLDGRECVVARFRLILDGDNSTPKDQTVSFLFWIDLDRCGHVVRFEERHRGDNLAKLTTVNLGRFDRGNGQASWIPISGKSENRMISRDKELVFLKEPTLLTTYTLIPMTIRFDRGFQDDAFSVEAKQGDAISDEIRKARYEFGQYMVRPKTASKRPTDSEIKANLDKMLKDSVVMAGELKASSPLREGPGVLSYWPWAVAGCTTLGAGFLFLKNRSLERQ